MKPRQKQKQFKSEDVIVHLKQQVFGLSLAKIVHDYWSSRGHYTECTEKFFEEWMFANFYTWTEDFENQLRRSFVNMLLIRGRQKETKQ